MRTLFITLFLLLAITSYAQQWQKLTSYDLGFPNNTILTTKDALNGNSRHFRINPYTNLPWMGATMNIRTLSSTGEAIRYWVTNEPTFNSSSFFVGFEFMENKVIALDAYYGLRLLENDIWSSVYSSNFCNSMILHNDTIHLLRDNLNSIKWANGVSEPSTNFGTGKRLLIQNDRYWLTSGYGQYGLDFYENGTFGYYDIDTCLLMDYRNYDFKFSPNTDTLYISGDKGLSMLHNNTFFDSIAPDNTTNMPSGKIIDFEFDTNDNIWALFGTDINTPTAVAHYDQLTKNWDNVFNSGDSNLVLSSYGSIELDTLGNVWFAGNNYLYVLELNGLPAWLSIDKIEKQESFSLFPNPSKNSITITSKNSEQIDKVEFYNAVGMECLTVPFNTTLDVSNLSEGFYHVKLLNSNNEHIGSLKLIMQ